MADQLSHSLPVLNRLDFTVVISTGTDPFPLGSLPDKVRSALIDALAAGTGVGHVHVLSTPLDPYARDAK